MENVAFCKVVFLGDSGAGKTSLLHAMLQLRSEPEMTIGCTFRSHKLTTDIGPVVLHLWDTCGQERFRCLTNTYLRGAKIAVIVIDPQKDISNQIASWVPQVKQNKVPIQGSLHNACEAMALSENLKHLLQEPSLFIVINKIDELEPDGLEVLKQKFDTAHFTSAITNNGTGELFETICKEGISKSEMTSTSTICLNTQPAKPNRCCF